jgi:hypothetical protein
MVVDFSAPSELQLVCTPWSYPSYFANKLQAYV